MDEKTYIYEVYKERSFSAAAKNLFVSQPALSTSVKKAEQALGITIFDRSTSPISLTEEGKLYIASLERIMKIEAETKERLSDLSEGRTGKITVSGENFVASFILPSIIMAFSDRYPGITVELVESNSPELRRELLTDSIDLLIAHDFDPALYTAVALFDEALLLARRPCHQPSARRVRALSCGRAGGSPPVEGWPCRGSSRVLQGKLSSSEAGERYVSPFGEALCRRRL